MTPGKVKSNILIQYTVISIITTMIIAVILSLLLINQTKKQIILVHSDFYRAFVSEIPHNYQEILPLIAPDIYKNQHEEKETDHESHSDDIWEHFQTDLLQYPSVYHFKIFNKTQDVIWKYVKDEIIGDGESLAGLMLEKKEFAYHIHSEYPEIIIHFYIPIVSDSGNIGVVEITDIDQNLNITLSESRKSIIFMILLAGLTFYSTLFLLFLRSYLNQKKTITQLERSQSLTIQAMSLLAELRDDNTGGHIKRTSLYCRALVDELNKLPSFKGYVTREYIKDIERSAPLHDIGKVGIPDQILHKPGRLTTEEFEIIKKHPLLGADVLQEAMEGMGFQSFFEIGYQIVLHHHENWDGSGYPAGLSGENIPLSARIMMIADVYDALRTERPYKEAFTHEKTMDIMIRDRGIKFDPFLIDIFFKVSETFRIISETVQE